MARNTDEADPEARERADDRDEQFGLPCSRLPDEADASAFLCK
jgi:hypothetical protein